MPSEVIHGGNRIAGRDYFAVIGRLVLVAKGMKGWRGFVQYVIARSRPEIGWYFEMAKSKYL